MVVINRMSKSNLGVGQGSFHLANHSLSYRDSKSGAQIKNLDMEIEQLGEMLLTECFSWLAQLAFPYNQGLMLLIADENNMCQRPDYKANWRQFLNWHSLFPGNSTLFVKLTKNI